MRATESCRATELHVTGSSFAWRGELAPTQAALVQVYDSARRTAVARMNAECVALGDRTRPLNAQLIRPGAKAAGLRALVDESQDVVDDASED